MDIKLFDSAIAQIAEEKGISLAKVMETIEMAIAAAYKKDYGKKGQIIKASFSPKTGEIKFWQIKIVVDEEMIYSEEELEKMKDSFFPVEQTGKYVPDRFKEDEEVKKGKKVRFNPEKHIMLKEAKKTNSKIKAGEELETALDTKKDYGRIAAQTAKQVIMQRIREAEKESVFNEYKSKEGEIISGIVQRVEGRNVFLDIGKTLGLLPREEQVQGEFYRPGQRLKVYVLKVEENPRGSMVFLSRAYPKIISKLFELEVPEVSSGQVQIKSIAREAGSRSKVAVAAEAERVDPIGSCVGQKGTRVMAVINELGGEKIDIVEYSPDPEKYIANSLSPAKVLEIKIMPKNKALAIVPEDQLSLAIGKDGQNVRLAAKLTGWKIDVRAPETQDIEETEDIPSSGQPLEEEKEETKESEVKKSESSEDAPKERKEIKKKKTKKTNKKI
ncbi:MAG: transcription termination factor NusA [Candidatus Nealsonbacteria bacterium]|nr:transcription termination factor NusA [Candidatus Nealsonbacteria bacterium]